MKDLSYRLQALALKILFAFFRLLPLDTASNIGGMLGRKIGPFLSAHRTAQKNLEMIFPEKTPTEIAHILRGMWDNLGRVAAELPYLPTEALYSRVTLKGSENFPKPGQPVLFFSAHLGNWELTYPTAFESGLSMTLIYRHANNPYVDKLITNMRQSRCTHLLPKGPRGALKMAHAIKRGDAIAMLIDQKMNDGIAVPFFGRPAMTAPAIAKLALRYDLPIIPARVARTSGCHFETTIFPPLAYEKTGDEEADVLAIMIRINALLENWIREEPEQWFWVHKRWPVN